MSAEEGGRAGLAPVMTPAATLRQFVNMTLVDVYEHATGIILALSPRGHMVRRHVFIEGATVVCDVTFDRQPQTKADDDQAQIDIGDDMYERERYEARDRDIDLTGEENDPRTRHR